MSSPEPRRHSRRRGRGSSSRRGCAGCPASCTSTASAWARRSSRSSDELDSANTQMSYVLMAFTLAYGLFAVPAGRWGDRRGPRSVLTRIVVCVVGVHRPDRGRDRARSRSCWCGSCSGRRGRGVPERGEGDGAVVPGRRARPGAGGDARVRAARRGPAPAATAYLIDAAGWRWAFLVYGLLGVVWAVGFWFWFRDDPADAPRRERGGTRGRSAPDGAAAGRPTPARCRGGRCSPTAASSSSASSWCSARSTRTSSTRGSRST